MSESTTLDAGIAKALAELSDLTGQVEAAISRRDALVRRFDALGRDRSYRSIAEAKNLAGAIVAADQRIAATFAAIHEILDVISAIKAAHAK